MDLQESIERLRGRYLVADDHSASDYFGYIRELVALRPAERDRVDLAIEQAYGLVLDEIETNDGRPVREITFGTSGWRGVLGKDVFIRSVGAVTMAIVDLYRAADGDDDLRLHLGVKSLAEARQRGCLVGWDNRFGGATLGRCVAETLRDEGFTVYLCGESTTGVLSAALLQLNAAFSVNLTPSHNPLEYGGYKYNAADGGPAAAELTARITNRARHRVLEAAPPRPQPEAERGGLIEVDAFALWVRQVETNKDKHRIDYRTLLNDLSGRDDIAVVVDAVHGASRLHLDRLLGDAAGRVQVIRGDADVTFGGIAPEPSSENLGLVSESLRSSGKRLRVGAIIDPDADRIRFTDGETEIGMNHFGAMAYHFLHERKGLTGMVAKTVATSNLANSVAAHLGEEVFETRVGFKEFKPVIGTALVCFEESDGISIIGHTPEKDAYIGLLLALAMVLAEDSNLGDLKRQVEQRYGVYCPARDGVAVTLQGDRLLEALRGLERYTVGSVVSVGGTAKTIKEVITLDGRKIIFSDDSWLLIRPSGTEPKVRFYVESREETGTGDLVRAAREMLAEVGLLDDAGG